jgi:integrase
VPTVYKKRQSKFYYTNVWIDGRQLSRSTGRTSRREAEIAAAEIEKRLKSERQAQADAGVPLTLDAVAARYMIDVGDHHVGADNTRRLINLLITYFGPAKLVTEITHDDVLGLVRWRRAHLVGKGEKARPVSAYAVNDTTEQLKKLFAYLRPAVRHFPHEPEWRRLWLDEPKRKPRELTADEERRLAAAVSERRPDLWPLIEFARTCGKRKTNCYTLEWRQVNWEDGVIRMTGKGRAGGKDIAVAITPSIRAILWPLRGDHPVRVFTFEARYTVRRLGIVRGQRYPWTREGLRGAWNAVRAAAGLTGASRFRWHDLRSDFATKLLRSVPSAQGMKIVQLALDHEDIKTTLKTYADVTDAEHAAAIERLAQERRAREMRRRAQKPVQQPVQPNNRTGTTD